MITVFGATGTIGTHLVAALTAKGEKLRLVTHNPDRRAGLEAQGHEVAIAEFSDPASLERACQGADKVFLVTPAHVDIRQWKANVIAAASKTGVRHIVMCTGLGASPKARLTFGIWHSESQELLKDSGLDWTLVQPTYFMQNLLGQKDSIAADGVYLDDLGGPVAWVDARDIADIAAEALTGTGHAGKAYGLTGPAALSGDEIAGLIGAATGRTVTSRAVTPDAARAAMIASGSGVEVADAMVELASLAPKGYLAGTETTVADVLGRPARNFADFITENAAVLAG